MRKSIDIQLSNDELLNVVGKGDSGFNWMEADEKSFEQAEFKYSAGNDYKLEKQVQRSVLLGSEKVTV